ncbi:MAG TPA: hypothetical protein VK357_10820 [Rubrobacteraceae bacterium]|jgi:hypothetical protein|nr:hypothetical protein [Rubrobacteraceae bacterium]
MTDEKSLADRISEQTTTSDSHSAHQTPGRRRWTDVLVHRWPTALGIAVAALAAFDLQDGLEFATLIILMALVYLGAAALDRRWSAWAVLLAGLLLAFFIPSTSEVVPSVVLLVAALVFLALGVARGQLREPGGLTLQTAGMLAFGSTALVALYVNPALGGKLVAVALIGHAAWDAYHFMRNKVVSRSYAEFCGVVDLLLGVAILFMT